VRVTSIKVARIVYIAPVKQVSSCDFFINVAVLDNIHHSRSIMLNIMIKPLILE